MHITDLLDKSKTLEERVKILKEAYKDEFKELDGLDLDVISQISTAVNDLIKESNRKSVDLDMSFQEQNRILNEISETDLTDLNSSDIRDLKTRQTEARKRVDEIVESKSRISINEDILEILNDKKVSIENSAIEEAKRQAEISMNYIRNNIESLNNSISQWKGFLNKYIQNEQELKEALASLIGIEDTPEKDEMFNNKLSELEDVEERIVKCTEKINEFVRSLEEEQKKLSAYEKNPVKEQKKEEKIEHKEAVAREKEEAKEQRREEKEEKAELKKQEAREKLMPQLEEFTVICSKNELSFLEKERRASLYHILANSKVLEKEEKQEMFEQYIKSINKTGKEIIGKCSDKLKPQKQIPIISSARSMIAKGAIATINQMEKIFDKVKTTAKNLASGVIEKVQKHEEKKLDNTVIKIEKLKEMNEKLKNIDMANNVQDNVEEDEVAVKMAM